MTRIKYIVGVVLALALIVGVASATTASAREAEQPGALELSSAPANEVTVRHEASPVETHAVSRTAQRSHVAHTWRAYYFGVQLYRYTIDVRWTHNGRRVWNVDAGRDGSGSWGWHFCGSRPAGQVWIGLNHHAKRIFGFGHFGQWPISPGCILGDRILGGSVNVGATGVSWVRNGSCCDTCGTGCESSATWWVPEQEWALAA